MLPHGWGERRGAIPNPWDWNFTSGQGHLVAIVRSQNHIWKVQKELCAQAHQTQQQFQIKNLRIQALILYENNHQFLPWRRLCNPELCFTGGQIWGQFWKPKGGWKVWLEGRWSGRLEVSRLRVSNRKRSFCFRKQVGLEDLKIHATYLYANN